MSFNRNDLQGDDDFNFENDFNFDDAGGDEFKFDDEPADIGLGDDEAGDGGFGFEDEDMPELGDDGGEGGEQRGTSRTFIILAAVMIVLFILGLGAVVLISLNNSNQPTPFQETSAAIEALNGTTVAQLAQTQTMAPQLEQTQAEAARQTAVALTQVANVPTETPRPPTVTPTFTLTPQPALDETQLAATSIAQQTEQAAQLAFSLTQTALVPTPTSAQPSVGDVALTATALVQLLQPPGQGSEVPTQEAFATSPGGVIPTALPQTGFFDDLAAGNANAGLIALLALGLVGVIGISRYLRTANNK